MKARGIAFILFFALALGLFTGASAHISAVADGLRYDSRVLLGERSEAGGVSVRQESILEGHYIWELAEDAGSGTQSLANGFSLSRRSHATEQSPAGFYFNVGVDSTVSDSDLSYGQTGKLEEQIYSYALSTAGALGAAEQFLHLCLNDFTDTLPISVWPSGSYEADGVSLPISVGGSYSWDPADVSGCFSVPLPENTFIDVSCSVSPQFGSIVGINWSDSGPVYNAGAGFTLAADGSFYGPFYIVEENYNTGARRVLSGSAGIWRVPGFAGEAQNGQPAYIADFSAAELIYPMDYEFYSAFYNFDAAGENMLLITCEPDGLYLTVFELAAGAPRQRALLLSRDEAAALEVEYPFDYGRIVAGEGCYVLESGGLRLVFSERGGLYSTELAINGYGLPTPALAPERYQGEWFNPTSQEYVLDGERLILLVNGWYVPEDGYREGAGAEWRGFSQLSVFRDGECVYVEWLESPLEADSNYGYSQNPVLSERHISLAQGVRT